MYGKIALLVLACIVPKTWAQTLNRCFPYFTDDRVAFDVSAVDVKNAYAPYTQPVATFVDNNQPVVGGVVTFKMCSAIDTPPQGCTKVPECIGYFQQGSACYPMTTLISDIERNLIRVNGDIGGVSLGYNNDKLDANSQQAFKYKLRFVLNCDKDMTGNYTWTTSFENGYIILTSKGPVGCKYGISDILDFFTTWKYITFPAFIAFGVILCFFGRHAYRWTLLGVGLLLGILLVWGFCTALGLLVGASDQKRYIIYGVAIAVGCLLAYLMFRFQEKMTSLVVAALAMIIFKAIMAFFFPSVQINGYLEFGLLMVCSSIGGFIAYHYKDDSLIWSTGLGGSFLIVLLAGLMTGTLDSPGVMQAKAKNGESLLRAYLWGGAMIVLAAVGIWYQYRQLNKEGELKEHLNPKEKEEKEVKEEKQ